MQIRATVHLDTKSKKLVMVSHENETPEHLALKLAAFILFFNSDPIVEISSKHFAIANQEFKPDLLSLDETGDIRIWIECGNVTTNKMEKLARRIPDARIIVLKEIQREAENLRRILEKNEVKNREHIEIWSFPENQFAEWMKAMDESVEVYGEMSEHSFNLVANSIPFNFDFLKF